MTRPVRRRPSSSSSGGKAGWPWVVSAVGGGTAGMTAVSGAGGTVACTGRPAR